MHGLEGEMKGWRRDGWERKGRRDGWMEDGWMGEVDGRGKEGETNGWELGEGGMKGHKV